MSESSNYSSYRCYWSFWTVNTDTFRLNSQFYLWNRRGLILSWTWVLIFDSRVKREGESVLQNYTDSSRKYQFMIILIRILTEKLLAQKWFLMDKTLDWIEMDNSNLFFILTNLQNLLFLQPLLFLISLNTQQLFYPVVPSTGKESKILIWLHICIFFLLFFWIKIHNCSLLLSFYLTVRLHIIIILRWDKDDYNDQWCL